MYKIGQFSILGKTTIKTLRYYEKEKLLTPSFVDINNYRYYELAQLKDLSKILSLRELGFSIDKIKKVLNGEDIQDSLIKRKREVEKEINKYKYQLLRINYLLEEKNMKYEVTIKTLPEYTIYYKEGVIKDFSKIPNFILSSAEECKKLNKDIECLEEDYCYLNYLDGEYKDKDIKIRYAQAVKESGIENENIKFETLKPVEAVCLYHKGSYGKLPNAYSYIMKYIEENNYEIIESPRERYIDGMWNKEDESEWLTEIQVPVIKK